MNSVKTLLISDGSSSVKIVDANEILLRFLSSVFKKESLCRVILTRANSNTIQPDDWNGYKYITLKRIKDSWFSLFRFLSCIPSSLSYIYLLIFVIPKQSKQISNLIEKEKISKLWVVITSPQVIFIARKLLKINNNLRIYSSVWDAPEEFSLMLHMPGIFRLQMLRDFSYVMNHSIKIGVASANMKKEYEIRFRKDCFILQGDVIGDNKKKYNSTGSDENMIIGFAGAMYTPEVWASLFQALDLAGWKIKNKVVKIRIIGNPTSFGHSSAHNIEYLGNLPVNEVIDLLSDSFVNFVPYRFSTTNQYGSSVSFPSKISTYLAARKPIFTISPSYSTPYQFVNETKTGISCATLVPADILKCLNEISDDEVLYKQIIMHCEETYMNQFHPDVFKNTFNKFIE